MNHEDRLRDALRAQSESVGDVPVWAAIRTRAERRRARRTTRTAVVMACAVAVTAAVIVGVGIPGTHNPGAFAAWSAAPSAPTAGQVAAAESECSTRSTAQQKTAVTKPGQPAATLSPVAVDTRGPFTLIWYAGNTWYAGSTQALCISGPSFTKIWPGSLTYGVPASPVDAKIALLSHTGADRDAYTVLAGWVGPTVTALTLDLNDGTTVTATIANRAFLAWWPGTQDVHILEVATPNGVHTTPLTPPNADRRSQNKRGGPMPAKGA
jgi:hypothetical protein